MAQVNLLRIGTRRSPLALWQARWVARQLAEQTGVDTELVEISTQGDQRQVESIGSLGSQGVFTKEIHRALLQRRIDVAVHSLKDLPTEAVDGLTLAAVPERASSRDALISRQGHRFDELPRQARVGTGSLRRRSQLWHRRPDLQMVDIRGNVETRLRKLRDGEYDALVLAEAGIRRLGLEADITELLPTALMLPAVGQGALGIEGRCDDPGTLEVLGKLDDPKTRAAVVAERTMLAELRGGCLAPVGGWGRFEADGRLHLSGVVLSADGQARLEATQMGDAADAIGLGQGVAQELLAQGAAELIHSSRQSERP